MTWTLYLTVVFIGLWIRPDHAATQIMAGDFGSRRECVAAMFEFMKDMPSRERPYFVQFGNCAQQKWGAP